jgi:hypothetical protein
MEGVDEAAYGVLFVSRIWEVKRRRSVLIVAFCAHRPYHRSIAKEAGSPLCSHDAYRPDSPGNIWIFCPVQSNAHSVYTFSYEENV